MSHMKRSAHGQEDVLLTRLSSISTGDPRAHLLILYEPLLEAANDAFPVGK
jgi:hypothetical protein